MAGTGKGGGGHYNNEALAAPLWWCSFFERCLGSEQSKRRTASLKARLKDGALLTLLQGVHSIHPLAAGIWESRVLPMERHVGAWHPHLWHK